MLPRSPPPCPLRPLPPPRLLRPQHHLEHRLRRRLRRHLQYVLKHPDMFHIPHDLFHSLPVSSRISLALLSDHPRQRLQHAPPGMASTWGQYHLPRRRPRRPRRLQVRVSGLVTVRGLKSQAGRHLSSVGP